MSEFSESILSDIEVVDAPMLLPPFGHHTQTRDALSENYHEQFKELFGDTKTLGKLSNLALRGNIAGNSSKFRSLCWMYCLNCLPNDTRQWPSIFKSHRHEYSELREKHCSDRRRNTHLNLDVNNPLSQDENSPWNQYFADEDLRNEIQRDVDRTCPGNDFYKRPMIQRTMLDVLFIYAKENSLISYRQGMHELLAAVIHVIYHDEQMCSQYLGTEPTIPGDALSLYQYLFDPQYMEHDAYKIFVKIMEGLWDWYYVRPSSNNGDGAFLDHNGKLFRSDSCLTDSCSAFVRLNSVWENVVRLHDSALYNHLNAVNISSPQVFGISWMKLMFSRQFKQSDFLELWDAIFAIKSSFGLCEFILASMVLAIKPLLMGHDENDCNLLLVSRYPSDRVNVRYVIDQALNLFDPMTFPKARGSPLLTEGQAVTKKLFNMKINKQIALPAVKRTKPKSETSPLQSKTFSKTPNPMTDSIGSDAEFVEEFSYTSKITEWRDQLLENLRVLERQVGNSAETLNTVACLKDIAADMDNCLANDKPDERFVSTASVADDAWVFHSGGE